MGIFTWTIHAIAVGTFIWAMCSAHTALCHIGEYFEEKKKRVSNKKVCDLCFKAVTELKEDFDV